MFNLRCFGGTISNIEKRLHNKTLQTIVLQEELIINFYCQKTIASPDGHCLKITS